MSESNKELISTQKIKPQLKDMIFLIAVFGFMEGYFAYKLYKEIRLFVPIVVVSALLLLQLLGVIFVAIKRYLDEYRNMLTFSAVLGTTHSVIFAFVFSCGHGNSIIAKFFIFLSLLFLISIEIAILEVIRKNRKQRNKEQFEGNKFILIFVPVAFILLFVTKFFRIDLSGIAPLVMSFCLAPLYENFFVAKEYDGQEE